MQIIENIQLLSTLSGVSGDETSVRLELQKQLDGICVQQTDPLGNLSAYKKGKALPHNKILLSAHMDETGFIITHIEENGLLRFACVGGIDSRVVVGKSVEVGAERIYGVIGVKAVHLASDDERETPLKTEDLYIDIGAESAQQALDQVQPGDRAVFFSKFQTLGTNKILGKAFDDRAGCAILSVLAGRHQAFDCTFLFSVQEETGCAGAAVAAYSEQPDIAIIVEATTASDIAGIAEDKKICKLGSGPVLSFMDRGTLYDRELFRIAVSVAKKNNIPFQIKQGVFGGNESRAIQTAACGTRVLAVNLPCRYIHSPSCVLDTRDIQNTVLLLEKLIEAFGNL